MRRALADLAHLRGDRQFVEALERQIYEDGNSVLEVARRQDEGRFLLDIGSFDSGRVFDAPMRGHRLPRPDRTGFARRVVADREHEIHFRRAGRCKFFPSFRAQALGRIIEAFEHFESERIDSPLRVASSREGAEAPRAVFAQNAFGEDRARGVARAEKQDVEDAISHERTPQVDSRA